MERRPGELKGASLTLAEAASWLSPPITEKRLWHAVKAAGIASDGRRRKTSSGQPQLTYPMRQLIKVHRALLPWLVSATPPTGPGG